MCPEAAAAPEVLHAVHERGYTVVPFLSHGDVVELRHRFDALAVPPDHSFFTSCNDLPRAAAGALDDELRRRMADRVEQLLPGYRTFLASFISKGAGAGGMLEYHQDLTYTDERTDRAVLVWAPLVPTRQGAGALRVVPGSHLWSHGIRPGSRGAQPTAGLQDGFAAASTLLEVEPGQAVVYDPALVHGSEANTVPLVRPVLGLATAPVGATLVHFALGADGRLHGARVGPGFASEHSLFEPAAGFPPEPAWTGAVTAEDLARGLRALHGTHPGSG